MHLTTLGRLAALILASTILAGCTSPKPVRVQVNYKNVAVALDLELRR